MIDLRPIGLQEANAWIEAHHSHHPHVRGHKFSTSAWMDGELVGVAIVGRPVARVLDDGMTLEVTRLCTVGHRNVASRLLGAVRRAARAMGYRRLVSYTLEREEGIAYRAAGWERTERVSGRGWDRPSRPRETQQLIPGCGIRRAPREPKVRWEVRL